ncbi:MAG: F0F1 ATP synthase subunit A [Bacteroidales bacterium]|jgi:F-type H+-transporting ATPase subunit a|nr:F0F1 ATP synthase subunit A [Bacteroidales bacterium]MCI2122236.1 F0F1 ATP synthase subunit A [Bacteroidales bacterium]MCI2144796.1 F0F1 ATP synthase subunit A [Bacteroidales bacterium]
MVKRKFNITIICLAILFAAIQPAFAQNAQELRLDSLETAQNDSVALNAAGNAAKKKSLDIKSMIFGHVGDSYEWNITKIGNKNIKIVLPVILISKRNGIHAFSFSKFAKNSGVYDGFHIAPAGSPYAGKIVEYDGNGKEVRPMMDISITRTTLAIFINGLLLLIIILSTAHWYLKHPDGKTSPKGFVGFMEMFIMMVENEIVKECVGPNYKKFSPYLLTAFFFILLSNVMGLLPCFPGGISITANISITLVLALFTFFITNVFGTKKYWKGILWPDVPVAMKAPLMQLIEFIGMLTKPFALMVRLFGNMLAGHMGMFIITCLIFIGATISPVMTGAMSVVSILLNVFMSLLELLVAFIQAYVFTMLSAVFIGLAQEKEVGEKEVVKK